MKRNFIISFLFVMASLQLFAQNTVKGLVMNQNREEVAFANIVLMEDDSTTVYKGAVSDERGQFIFEDVVGNEYVLVVSFMGFVEYTRKISINDNTSLEPVVLLEDSAALEEVTVNARRPQITRGVDRITFNVENSTLSTGNTYEILKRTPGVIVSQGQLLVRNRPATVYINDRKVYLTQQELQQLLEGFSGVHVQSIEVITNPPAKYDAEGGAILNIKTSKNPSIGYKGSFNASNTVAVVPKYQIGTSQYYKKDWINLFANYNFNSRFDYKKDESRIEYYKPDGTVDSRWMENFERDTRTFSHNINTILDFTLTDKSSLSLSANILLTPKADSENRGLTEIYNAQQSLDSSFTTTSNLNNEQDNILLNATYDTEIGENGAALTAGANFIIYDDDRLQDLNTAYFTPNGAILNTSAFSTIANQKSNIYTGKVDVSMPWGSAHVETGIKYSGIGSTSGMDFFYTNQGAPVFDEELSDEFEYNEHIYAGYASLERDWGNWSIKGGLRGEYTDVEGNSFSLGVVNTQEYFNIFPSFYLVHVPSENHSFGVDYSRRIARPRFQSLNPYRYFINENNYNIGNPNLRPSISNKINLNYTFKNKLSFDLYWDKADDSPALLPFQDNENRVFRTVNTNMDFEQQFSLDISYNDYIKDWWFLSIYSSVFHMQADFYALESGNQIVTNEVFSTFLMAMNYLTLSSDRTFSAEMGMYYLPDFISGSYDYSDQQLGISLGLRKTFFGRRLTATVNVEDLLNTMNIPLTSQYLNQNNSFYGRPESRMLRFGLIYKFGNFKLRDNNRAVQAEEGERLEEETRM